jgi:PAS domain S-box-containing protein
MENERRTDRRSNIWLLIAAMLVTSIFSLMLLLVPTSGYNLATSLIQVLLPLFCLFMTIRLYVTDENQNIKLVSLVLSSALLLWTLSGVSWYLLNWIIPHELHLGWLEKGVAAFGWMGSYCIIAYGLYCLKNSRQWYQSPPVNRLINFGWLGIAAIFVAWLFINVNWSSSHVADIAQLSIYILLDIFIIATFTKLFMMNLQVELKYLIISIFGFCLLNSIGDMVYLISYIADISLISDNRYFITGIVYSASVLFLSSMWFIYLTNDIRQKALGRLSKKLKDTALAMENIVMQSPDAMCICDTGGKVVLANDMFLDMLNVKRSEITRQFSLWTMPERVPGISMDALEQLREGKCVTIPRVEMDGENSSPLYMMVKLFPIMTSDGKIASYAIVLEDISEQVQLEQELKTSVEEKEVLLKEIHHRVKNNLQIVYSMLSLQSGYIADKESLIAFRETQSRVMSMALFHEKLYGSKDLARVDFSEYIQALASKIISTYSVNGNVKMNIQIDNVKLGVDIAVPCGLMINEMISNSVKHAFPGGREGEITIEMHEIQVSAGKQYLLRVKDNGIGLPEGFDIASATTLGMVLIHSLVGQLNGTLDLKSTGGTEYTIVIGKKADQ